MKIIGIKTEKVSVDITGTEFIGVLSKALQDVYDFNPSTEYIDEKGYICYDVKYHTWQKESRRQATETDRRVAELYRDIEKYYQHNKF